MEQNHPDTTTKTVEITLDPSELKLTPVTVAIADAIAEFKDVEVTDIEPLFYSIDTEALDALFQNPNPANGGPRRFSFTHGGLRISVTADPEVQVTITLK